MAASTGNFMINPQDGWVKINSGDTANFLRVHHFPCHNPIFLAFGTSAPTGKGGLRSDHGKVWFNGGLGTGVNVYARVQNNSNGPVSVSVFQN